MDKSSVNPFEKWYSKRYVRALLLPQFLHKECSFRVKKNDGRTFTRRNVYIASAKKLENILTNDAFTVTDLYTTIARYDKKGFNTWRGMTNDDLKQMFANLKPVSWRLVFDVDGSGNKPIHDAVDKLKTLTKTLNTVSLARLKGVKTSPKAVPERYSIKFSGGKGFHVRVRGHYFTDFDDWQNAGKVLGNEVADQAIYSLRRVWRCAYSVHHSGRVALPLTKNQLRTLVDNPDRADELTPERILSGHPVLGERVSLNARRNDMHKYYKLR